MKNGKTPQERAEDAADYLTSSSVKAAQARAEKVYLDKFEKRLLASLMVEMDSKLSVAAQERDALASPEYADWLQKIKAATLEDEKYRNLRDGANAILELWRTLSANERGLH